MQKIDFHIHVTPPEIICSAKKIARREKYFALLASNPKNKFVTAEEIIAQLDTAGFDRAVIFGFGFCDMGLCRLANDYVIEKVNQYPNRLIGFLSVVPHHKDAEKEIERCHTAGLCGVGEIFPEGQKFRVEHTAATSGFAAACAERSLPVLIHANEPVGHYYPGKTNTTLRQLEQFVTNHPQLKIILAHFGGGLLFYELMPEISKKFSNVYYDTAAQPFLFDNRIFTVMRDLGLTKKIIFGSDFPLLQITRYNDAIKNLTPDESASVLGGNAAQVLRLPCAFQSAAAAAF